MVILRLTKYKYMKEKRPGYTMDMTVVFDPHNEEELDTANKTIDFLCGISGSSYAGIENDVLTCSYQIHVKTGVNDIWRLLHNKIVRSCLADHLGVKIFNYYDTISYEDVDKTV